MAADLSRIRHNPLLDYSGVLLQQGRVLLDADFNELAGVVDRRLRALAGDVLGRGGTVSSTTPDAFRITAQGGTLRIGRGRLYVDGLLAECHGGPADDPAQQRFDPLMGEPTFPDPLGYTTQPWLDAPPALPTAGTHLVYLDVWEREVTAVEDPSLQEIALGVDTTARRQVVWQVRVLAEAAGAASCGSADEDVPGWSALIAPSVARLSTGSFEAPGSDDPCELPPSGGYRGLENQTYRVEVHDPGLPGAGGATFKWSRDNASVATRVTSIVSSTRLELASLGRDEVLRFNTGDWVEITDDLREQAQQAGEMRRITVDEAARAIAFDTALPAAMLPASFPDDELAPVRNLRVKRWDQSHQVLRVNGDGTTSLHHDLDAGASTGAIPVPAAGTTLLLERGVTVRFGVGEGGGRFRAGDHWVFAARTADASIEVLENAPPRGIHHHYARLGFWNVGAGTVSDCRHPWPPVGGEGHDCSCAVCVTPESHASGALTVQAAVDQVRERGGGTVCLALGQYVLERPVLVEGARSLRVRGEGAGTLLVAVQGDAFQISGGMAVAVEDLAVLGTAEGDLVHVHNTLGISLQRTVLAQLGESNASAAVGLSGLVLSAALRDNVVLAPHGVVAGTLEAGPSAGGVRTGFLMSGALRIDDNLFACRQRAVDLSGLVLHVLTNRIGGNDITSCRQDGVRLTGLSAPGAAMRVCDNVLSLRGGNGISAGVDGLWIEGNKLRAVRATGSQTPTGVGIRIEAGLDTGGPDECQVLANQLRGFEGGGVLIGRAGDLIVKLNIIAACGYGIWLQDESESARVSIENNHLSDIGNRGGLVSTVGIAVARAESAALSGNTISGVGQQAEEARMVVGIYATSVEQLRLSHNAVTDIGPAGNFVRGYSVGLMLRAPFAEADVSHNQVDRESVPLTQGVGRFSALWIAEDGAATATGQLSATAGSTTLVFGNRHIYTRGRFAAAGGALRSNAGVRGNSFGSRGSAPAVRVALDGDCHFSDNRCEWRGGGAVAVQLEGDATVLSGNRVRGGETSIQVRGNTKAVTVLGNITTGTIDIGEPLGAWAPFNVRG